MALSHQPYLPPCTGAQHTFSLTDKYTRKKTIRNWSKPCIWLNNKDPRECTEDVWKKDWLNANCVFVNLEHRLYMPSPVSSAFFQPISRPSPAPPNAPSPGNMEGPSRIPMVYLDDLPGPKLLPTGPVRE